MISCLAVIGGACSSLKIQTLPATAALSAESEADPEIRTALDLISRAPDAVTGYEQLAVIYIRRARKTGDFSLNQKAETAVKKALEIAPGDDAARKLQASLHLTYHRFDEALALGNELLQSAPNDAVVYGILADANAELGNYDEATASVQKMVDLRPNSASYSRVGHIRSLTGDSAGAIEMFRLAARTADPVDHEAQSWCLVQLGDEMSKYGRYAEAEKVYDEALQVLPDYYLAATGKGRVRAALGDLDQAIEMLTKTTSRIPNVDALILLGDIYSRLANAERAGDNYRLVEIVETGFTNDQKRLAMMWANNNIRLDDALAIAGREHKARKDIYTADALAWVLYRKGQFIEARAMMAEATRLGSNDARLFYHAGMIERQLGNLAAAKKLLKNALTLNPNFDIVQAPVAREALAQLSAVKRFEVQK